MSLVMSRPEREAFLAETRVAVAGPGPLTVPVWRMYEPGGDVRFVTGGSEGSSLVRLRPERWRPVDHRKRGG